MNDEYASSLPAVDDATDALDSLSPVVEDASTATPDPALQDARRRLSVTYLASVALVSAIAPLWLLAMPPSAPRGALTVLALGVAGAAGGAWHWLRQGSRGGGANASPSASAAPAADPTVAPEGSVLGPASSRTDPGTAARAVTAVALASSAALAIGAAASGAGVSSPLLGFIALHTALAAALGGRASGWAVGGFGLASVVALALAGGGDPAVRVGLAAAQGVLVACGVGAGALLARALRHSARGTVLRERDFRDLLQITADAYWELDPAYRLVALSRERAGGAPVEPALLGRVAWELPNFVCDADTLDQLQADLGGRQRFRDLPVAWRGSNGLRHFMISGEPRRDARGAFRGYWGVARDVTDEWKARHALALTESRYQDLFDRLPTPLVMHREGRVLDANPAALSLFGFRDLDAMLGADLWSMFADDGSSERMRARGDALAALAPGEALPVEEFHVAARDGRRAVVRATGIAVQIDEAPAVLSIFVDDTDRRRSETLLSHLVASSPDVIALTELATGRFSMVNRAFEQVLGWPATEVVGRSSAELGTWFSAEERQAFVRQVREQPRAHDLPTRFRRRDGTVLPMRVSGARFDIDGRDYLVINARDMSQAERDRLEREAILRNASIGIALTRGQRFHVVNPAFEQMLGWPEGALVGESTAVAWPSADAYADIEAQLGAALDRGEAVEVECEVRRRDDSRFVCRLLARALDPEQPRRGGTIWIVEDVTERKRVAEALARARDDAEAANRAKSAFLANTSHELRTPLNALLGLAGLAREPSLDPLRRTQYLEQISRNAKSLSQIVSDILDLSKIEAGKLVVECEPFDFDDLLAGVLRDHAEAAELHGLALLLDVERPFGWVRGDALRVRQILTNYLGNAVKFTSEGTVRLVVRRVDGGDTMRCEVQDTGRGIDAATCARLFQPFSQADPSTTRQYGGTGLGLSICRELATRMGGAVGVESQPGRGSRFWVTLPLPAAQRPAITDDDALQPDPSRHGARVLVVDDNEVNVMVATAQLSQLGLRPGCAHDGVAALDAVADAEAANDPFELVLMDLQMPRLSGYEVARRLRERLPAERLPIVAHTAAGLADEREQAVRAGMNDFLAKPTEPGRLRAIIERWVRPRVAPTGTSG